MSDYRPLGIASDLDNPNFQGPVNPDKLLHKEFYWHEPNDVNKTAVESEKAGKLVRVKGPRTIYIRIMARGDKNSIIERAKTLGDEIRFADEWRMFQINEGLIDAGENQPGWKIENKVEGLWELTDDEISKLKFLRFYTVEQIAGASDSQIEKLGMGGLGMRKRAAEACKARATETVRAELDEKDRQLSDMKARLEKMEAMLMSGAVPAAGGGQPPAPEALPRKKYTMTPEHKAKMAAAREAKKAAKGA